MNKFFVFLTTLALLFPVNIFAGYCGLDEQMSRKSRIDSSVFTSNKNSTTKTLQPESLYFIDDVTGHERWRLTFGKRFCDTVGDEHGMTGVWSGDGSIVGGRNRGAAGNSTGQRIDFLIDNNSFVVNSDGSKLSTPGMKGRCVTSSPWMFMNTERKSVILFSDTGEYADSLYYGDELYKYTFADDYANPTATLLLNINDGMNYSFRKNFLSGSDKNIIAATSGCTSGPNPIRAERATFFEETGSSYVITDSWSIARNATEFIWHSNDWEASAHSGSWWGVGQNLDKFVIQYEGSGSGLCFWELSKNGTYLDGGPVWEDWDGDSFGNNEMRLVSSNEVNGTFLGYGNPYWGHPAFDKWGTKAVVGHTVDYTRTTETDEEYIWKSRGTHIIEASNNWASRSGAVANKNDWDGAHHSWNAFSDYIVANQPSGGLIYTSDYRIEDGNATSVISLYRPIVGGSYFANPRPVQSPDGTKFIFHDIMFYAPYDGVHHDASAYNLNVAVAYYPHPPEITHVTSNAGTNTIRFDWRLDQANPRGYTHRGWPDEDTDNPPPPRETKEFRLWRSADGSTGWEPVAAVNATIFERYDFKTGEWTGTPYWEISDTPSAGTWYYAITSVEWSGLESRTLSNVYSSAGTQTAAYPSDPKGKSNFCTTFQPEITRYYNVYAHDGSAPSATQAMRIASIPVTAEKEYLDWLGAVDGSTQYLVAPVDSQGNEGEPLAGSRTVLETDGQYLVAWTDESGGIPVDPGDPEDPTPTTSGPILRTGSHLLRMGDGVLRVQ